MSGRIVHEAPERIAHRCARPEIWVTETDESAPFGRRHRQLHRCGTVWECSCGRTWVVTGPGAELIDEWEPEGRFARWRRERRTRQRRPDSGVVVLDPVTAPADVLPPSAAIVPRGQQKPHRQPPQTTSHAKPQPPPPKSNG